MTPSSTPLSASRRRVPPDSARLQVDLRSGEIRSVVWATGFRPDYGWLDVPVVDEKGRLRHEGGVVDSPGLYALGLPVLRRRKSTFIHGIEDDAREVIDHLAGYLATPGVISTTAAAGTTRQDAIFPAIPAYRRMQRQFRGTVGMQSVTIA